MDHQVDKLIAESVERIRDRFGIYGLRDLIALAQEELRKAEIAMRDLASDERPPPS